MATPSRVRSPGDHWTRYRPMRSLLPPEKTRDRSEGKDERRLSDEAERSVDQRNRERLGEETLSTPKKGDAETKVGRPSPEGKARTPEAKPADHQEKVRLRKQGPVRESETG
ncbi:hypothetical protein F2Q69_00020945 [Brassica cretica]|uniref:Uncharacterized protein n=1 Tax=Brassica cretica TaxID=69181 RepID=A0A8S9PW40_BRACR|nr:hypothetical protein F2Q69_00020945 [Brassica cretica]